MAISFLSEDGALPRNLRSVRTTLPRMRATPTGEPTATMPTLSTGAAPRTFNTAPLGSVGAYGNNVDILRGFAASDPNLLAQIGGEKALDAYIKENQQYAMGGFGGEGGPVPLSEDTQRIDKLLSEYRMNTIGAAGLDDGRRKVVIDPSGKQVYQGEAYSYKPAKENLQDAIKGLSLIGSVAGLSALTNGIGASAGAGTATGGGAGAGSTAASAGSGWLDAAVASDLAASQAAALGQMGAGAGLTAGELAAIGGGGAMAGSAAGGFASLPAQATPPITPLSSGPLPTIPSVPTPPALFPGSTAGGSGIDKLLAGLKTAGGNLLDKAIANPLQTLALGSGLATALGSKPGAGPSFDPTKAAQAQGDANRDASWFDAVLNRPDMQTPWGSSTWTLKEGADPKNPKPGDWINNVALDPAQQKLLEGQNALSQGYNDTAQGMLGRVQAGYNQPFDISGIPEMPDFGSINTDADRARIEEALLARLEPQLARDEESLRSRLINTGFEAGSAGTEIEMDRFGRAKNDARLSAIIQAGTEARGQSAEQRANLQAQQQARQQGFTEESLLRDRPLNELNALRSGSQVQAPQFQSIIPSNTQASPELDALLAQLGVQQSSAANKQSGYNALLQSLAGLGGAIWGGRP